MIPRVIAHRGASADCPENTFAAFDRALAEGCEAIELDVQITADGVPVVFHDATLAKVNGGRRRIDQLHAADLSHFDAGRWFSADFRGEPIPEFKEVVRRYAGRVELLVELKLVGWWGRRRRARRLTQAVIEELQRQRRLRRAWLLCFDGAVLEDAHRMTPELRRVRNLVPPATLGSGLRGRLGALSALSVDIRRLRPDFAKAVLEARCPLMAWTCNTDEQVRLARSCGVEGIMSDRPGWLAAGLTKAEH